MASELYWKEYCRSHWWWLLLVQCWWKLSKFPFKQIELSPHCIYPEAVQNLIKELVISLLNAWHLLWMPAAFLARIVHATTRKSKLEITNLNLRKILPSPVLSVRLLIVRSVPKWWKDKITGRGILYLFLICKLSVCCGQILSAWDIEAPLHDKLTPY